MSCTPAAACKAALAEATRLFPNRNKASDGICASAQHTAQNPTSDHETGDAFDLTHDPANGCDVDALFARIIARRDPRVKYLIRNSRILRSYAKPGIPAWTWSAYTGSNPHTKHGHCSIVDGARSNTDPWFTTTTGDDDMPGLLPDERKILDAIRDATAQLVAVAHRDIDELKPLLEQVLTEVKDDPNSGSGAGDVDPEAFVVALKDALAKGTT